MGNVNSANLIHRCGQNDWVARNAFFAPTNNDARNLETRHIADGANGKQIDYMLLEQRYRNWVGGSPSGKLASRSTPMQHRAIVVDVEVILKSNYPHPKKNPKCPYNMRQARLFPEKAQKAIHGLQHTDIPLPGRWTILQTRVWNIHIQKLK